MIGLVLSGNIRLLASFKTRTMKRIIFAVLFIFSIVIAATAQVAEKQVKQLDKYITTALKSWNPPGLAVTVVKDGEIVFTGTYGTRSLANNKPVDEHTLFVCASTTKAFTAAALAMLVDEGKVHWDDHVIDYLPEFQLSDPYITREITIRDLLTHRTGIGNTDYLWSWMHISGDSALYKMREVKPSYSLRAGFIYQNLMYLAAGRVIERASGLPWEEFLQERIYNPLDMQETYPFYELVKDQENKADAHLEYEGKVIRIDQAVADEIGPAGSMWSSIHDMGKWIRFLLNEGVVNGDTLIQPASLHELFAPQQIIPANEFYPTMALTRPLWTTYGLGWFQHDYRGRMVQFHTGSLPGMVAIAGLLPAENIGVYVMGNLDHVELRHAIMYTVFDLFIDGKITRDWSSELKTLYDQRKASIEDGKPPKKEGTAPTLSAAMLTGTYVNRQFGKIVISQEDGTLHFNLNNYVTGSLKHWHYDTYEVIFATKWYGEALLTFRMNAAGETGYLEIFGRKFNFVNPNKK